ncbi:MAG TPA: PH domain-containing protein [Candidatus Saccharibacteria bacterium]|nr:PH domain-containing protein [Candidatus Saccharibacteria bacterium]HRK93873.1 PH domain-containing protein [Candidatus Saccharibacteria bacterium]
MHRQWTMPKIITRYNHPARIREELEELGVSRLGLATMEAQYLPNLVDADEHIGGIVYGLYPEGFAVLVATDKKIIFLDKKPLFINEDEITYDVVSGISVEHAGIGSTVTLHTRIKDYPIRAYNSKCIHNFVRFIESKCLAYKHLQRKEI